MEVEAEVGILQGVGACFPPPTPSRGPALFGLAEEGLPHPGPIELVLSFFLVPLAHMAQGPGSLGEEARAHGN